MSSWYNCWICDGRHPDDDFPKRAGVPITWGGMGFACREVFDTLEPVKQQQVRLDGIARFERRERAKAEARS